MITYSKTNVRTVLMYFRGNLIGTDDDNDDDDDDTL
jgi:hypothetical protein